jgi:Translation initiation factor IF-2, N-terminal region
MEATRLTIDQIVTGDNRSNSLGGWLHLPIREVRCDLANRSHPSSYNIVSQSAGASFVMFSFFDEKIMGSCNLFVHVLKWFSFSEWMILNSKNVLSFFTSGTGTAEIPTKTDFTRRRKVPGSVPPKRTTENDREGAKRKTSLRVRSGRSSDTVQRRGSLKRRDRSSVKAMKAEAALERKTVRLVEGQSLTVSQLADLIDEKPVAIIKMLMTDLGVMASMTQSLDPATCLSVVKGFGKVVAGEDDMDMDEYVYLFAFCFDR